MEKGSVFFSLATRTLGNLEHSLKIPRKMKKFSSVTLVLVFLWLLGSCSDSSSEDFEQIYSETNLENQKVTVDPNKMEKELLGLINEHRTSIGLSSLADSAPAYKYAEEHNNYMISKNSLSHDNFETRASKIADETNALKVSENVARFYTTAQRTLKAWVESDSHRKAMEGDFSHTTLSVQLDKDGRPYFTQIFIKVE